MGHRKWGMGWNWPKWDENEGWLRRKLKKNEKLETPPHKYVLKKVSVTISFNLYKY